jgi:hypothetical protein
VLEGRAGMEGDSGGTGDQLQHVGAALFLFEGAFDRLYLAAYPAHPVNQLRFLADRMRHLTLHRIPLG